MFQVWLKRIPNSFQTLLIFKPLNTSGLVVLIQEFQPMKLSDWNLVRSLSTEISLMLWIILISTASQLSIFPLSIWKLSTLFFVDTIIVEVWRPRWRQTNKWDFSKTGRNISQTSTTSTNLNWRGSPRRRYSIGCVSWTLCGNSEIYVRLLQSRITGRRVFLWISMDLSMISEMEYSRTPGSIWITLNLTTSLIMISGLKKYSLK